MIGVLVAAAVVVMLSLLVGRLVWRLCGVRTWSWSSGPVGLGVLLVIGPPALHAPGRMGFAAVLALLLAVAGLVFMVREREGRPPLVSVLAVIPAALLALLPFAANGRSGILGVSFNNDLAAHLLLADALRAETVEAAAPLLSYYPLGPHALAAYVGTGLGVGTDVALMGVIVSLPVLLALTALRFLDDVPLWGKAITATLTGLPFLAAAYFAQGAFKELVLALLLLGAGAAAADAHETTGVRRFVPLGAIVAGIVSAYSYLGLAWPVAALGLAWVVWLAGQARGGTVRAGLRGLVPAAALGAAAAVVLLLPQVPRIRSFVDWSRVTGIRKDDIGNLAGPIDPAEALGVWLQPDFRFGPVDTTPTTLWLLLLSVLLVSSVLWWFRRREPIVPLILIACALIWLVSEPGQSPYTVAKALAISSPFVFLLIGRAVLRDRPGANPALRFVPPILGVLVAGAAVWSSVGVLRNAEVGPTAHSDDLAAIRPLLEHRPTLYLGVDDFAAWELRGAPITQPLFGAPGFELRPDKGWVYGQRYDADTIAPSSLDRFDNVVTAHDPSASSLPANFRLVARHGVYELYRRRGPTPRRSVLAEGEGGAVVLDCKDAAGRRLSGRDGVAAVRGPSVAIPLAGLQPGQRAETAITLTPGTWDLTMKYTSPRALRLQMPGLDRLLPAALERVGSVWPAGTVRVVRDGPVPVALTADQTRLGPAKGNIAPTALIAQRRGGDALVPLARACGRNVDWYTTR